MSSLIPFTAQDDQFHDPGDEIWFTETSWFSFHVPERNLSGWLYGFLRPNIGINTSSVFIYDHNCTGAPWTALYYHQQQAHPENQPRDLTDYTFPAGYRVQVVEPTNEYRLTFKRDELIEVDFTFTGSHAPVPFQKGAFVHSMHYDQIGHIRGTLKLGDEVIQVDCHSIRDRSWGPRTDVSPPTFNRISYDYAGNASGDGFCIFADQHEFGEGGTSELTHGFWLIDGRAVMLEKGTRTCTRDPKEIWIDTVTIEAVDVEGNHHRAVGKQKSHFLWPPSRWICSCTFMDWDVDGRQAWGEDQDLWRYEQWIAAWRRANVTGGA